MARQKRKEYKTNLSTEEAHILEEFMRENNISRSATALRELLVHYGALKATTLTKDEKMILDCYNKIKESL
jgi:hypothetical protein